MKAPLQPAKTFGSAAAMQRLAKPTKTIVDNRPQAIAQRKLTEVIKGRGTRKEALASRSAAQRNTIQREIDNSSSHFLPVYEANEIPAWQDEQGIPEWAQQAYGNEQSLLVSMTHKGKIGSVYFNDGSRIRLTHSGGPAKEHHVNYTTTRYNVDDAESIDVFEKAFPKAAALTDDEEYWEAYDSFVKRALTSGATLSWATPITSVDKAPDYSRHGNPVEGLKLLELFQHTTTGSIDGVHPSRGAIVKLDMTNETVQVVKDAITYVESLGDTDVATKNKAFYEFISNRDPAFAQMMRTHEEVMKEK